MLIIDEREIYDLGMLCQWIQGRNKKGQKKTAWAMSADTGVDYGLTSRLLGNAEMTRYQDVALYSVMRIMRQFNLSPIAVDKASGKKYNISKKNAYKILQMVDYERGGKKR